MTAGTYKAVLMMVGANIVFCAMACLVRLLSGMNVWMTTLFRFLMGIGIICLVAMSGKIKLQFVNSKGLFIRGLIGGVSTALFFQSINQLGLIRAGFIASLYPAFAVLFGVLLLKERISFLKGSALVGAFAGVLFFMKDTSVDGWVSGVTGLNEILALCGSMLAGLTVVSIKKLQTTDSSVAIFLAQCLIGTCIVFVPASTHTISISPNALLVLLTIGLLATGGQLLMTKSYRYISVSTGSLIVMTTPVFNCCAGVLFFHESMTLQSALGAVVILASIGLIIIDNVSVKKEKFGI